jgi:tRNA (cmo5U34)-methyltransferase
MTKSTVDEIRARFDADVERFSNLETGQTATIDATLCLELVAKAAAAVTPHATHVLDIGCGAGNFTLRLHQELPFSTVTLLDLSQPMLTRAASRAIAAGLTPTTRQADVREADFPPHSFDLIVAGAVLHHLRTDAEWEQTFAKLHSWLRPGGSLWIFDMVSHEHPAIEAMQRQRWTDYLTSFGGPEYAAKVTAYVEKEDTPRPLTYQLELLRRTGFATVDVLHKNAAFAAFGATIPPDRAPDTL